MERIPLMRKLIFTAATVTALSAPLAGCNTVGGFGEDLQTLGNAMTRASVDAQNGNASGSASNDVELCGGSGASRRGNC